MRIVIVTVYNSMNSGSYLQAFSLYKALTDIYGENVFFLRTGARTPKKDTIKYCLKKSIKLDFNAAIVRKKMYDDLSKYVKKLPEIGYDELDYSNDVFVLGSDEIWNIRRKCMSNYPVFWGTGLPAERTIAYAPSLNRSVSEDVLKFDYAKTALANIRFISVRDNASKIELSKICDRDIELVCDPTNLIDNSQFIDRLEVCNDENYILIYINPGKLSDEQKESIKRFARDRKLKLISFSFQNNWCDKIINGSPYLFLSYIYHADYVFTATFHGTTFSLLFNKQFVSFDESNQKVIELLSVYGLSERLLRDEEIDRLSFVADEKYDKELLNTKVRDMRSHSLRYLTESIDAIRKEK